MRKVLREGSAASVSPSFSAPLPYWILGSERGWDRVVRFMGELSLLGLQDSQVLGEGEPLSCNHGPCYSLL